MIKIIKIKKKIFNINKNKIKKNKKNLSNKYLNRI